MIKFVIGLIAFILLLLMGYMIVPTSKNTPTTFQHTVINPEVVMKEKPSHTLPKAVSQQKELTTLRENTNQVSNLTNEIGNSLTLESIENASLDDERERMINDMVYYQIKHTFPSKTSTRTETLELIINDVQLEKI